MGKLLGNFSFHVLSVGNKILFFFFWSVGCHKTSRTNQQLIVIPTSEKNSWENMSGVSIWAWWPLGIHPHFCIWGWSCPRHRCVVRFCLISTPLRKLSDLHSFFSWMPRLCKHSLFILIAALGMSTETTLILPSLIVFQGRFSWRRISSLS